VNISGQLVSLSEVRDVLLEHPFVADAEAVIRDPRTLVACVVPVAGAVPDAALAGEVLDTVRDTLGGLARPRGVLFVDQFGGELSGPARQRALAAVAAAIGTGSHPGSRHSYVTWHQVLAVPNVDDPAR